MAGRRRERAARQLQGRLDDTAAELGRTGKEAADHIKPVAQQAVTAGAAIGHAAGRRHRDPGVG